MNIGCQWMIIDFVNDSVNVFIGSVDDFGDVIFKVHVNVDQTRYSGVSRL